MGKYQPGQIWKYHTRPGEEASRLVVCQVNTHTGYGSIIFVNVRDLVIKVPFAFEITINKLAYLPLTERAIDESVIELENDDVAIPDFFEGYQQLREALKSEEGDAFTLPVYDLLQMIESSAGPVEVIDHEVVVFTGGGGSGEPDYE